MLVVVSIAVFVASLDLFIVNIAFPDIQSGLRGAPASSGISWVLNAYAIVYAALLGRPPAAWPTGYGRRRGFLVGGWSSSVVGSALCGLAPSVETLVAARVLQAVGAAILTPSSLALLCRVPARRARRPRSIWARSAASRPAGRSPIGGLPRRGQLAARLPRRTSRSASAALFYAVRILQETRDDDRRAPGPDRRRACLAAAVGLLVARPRRGSRLGLGRPPHARVLRGRGGPPRRVLARAAPAIPRR